MAKAFQINVSKWTRLSKVLVPCGNPHCILDKSQLDSRNYTTPNVTNVENNQTQKEGS
jgi:hypothetical protein